MNKLEIIVDVSPIIDSRKSGVGYFAEGLIKSLSNSGRVTIYGHYFDFLGRKSAQKKSVLKDLGIKPLPVKFVPGRVLSLISRLTGVAPPIELLHIKHFKHAVYLNYASYPSLRKQHKSIAIYDMCMYDTPDFVDDKNLRYLLKVVPKSVRRADSIICISDFTRDRLIRHFPESKRKIIVTGIPPVVQQKPASLSKRLKDMGIKQKQYLLFVGNLEPRKNLAKLVKAFGKVNNPGSKVSLVLAGSMGWKNEAIKAAIDEATANKVPVILTGYVSDQERLALYKSARGFVMPSHYEGFGMPILEAMVNKLPILVSDIPVFKEIAGNSVEYFEKDNLDSLTKNLQLLIKNGGKNINYNEILSKLSWDNVGHMVLSEIERTDKFKKPAAKL